MRDESIGVVGATLKDGQLVACGARFLFASLPHLVAGVWHGCPHVVRLHLEFTFVEAKGGGGVKWVDCKGKPLFPSTQAGVESYFDDTGVLLECPSPGLYLRCQHSNVDVT